MSQDTAEHAAPEGAPSEVHTGHPTAMTYFKVAMALSIITAIEVGIFYLTWLGHGIIPILAVLSIAKFALVGMFYMHLKYDAQLFSGLFIAGLATAVGVVLALMALFRFFV
jgi:caa(3)-type oxidase subunit IV